MTERGGRQQLSQRKGACFLLNKKEALSGLIQVNGDENRKGGQAGRVFGCQLQVQPLENQYKPTPKFRNRKIPRFDRYNPIIYKKISLKKGIIL